MHYKSRPPLDKSKSAPEKILKKQDKIEQSLNTGQNYRITLPTSTLENFVLDQNNVHIDPKVLRLKSTGSHHHHHHSMKEKKDKGGSGEKQEFCGKSSIMRTIVENHPTNTFQSLIVKEQEILSTSTVKVHNSLILEKQEHMVVKSEPKQTEKKTEDVDPEIDVEPLHSGILHMRQPQFRFGPRWTRFRTSLDGKRRYLQVGQQANVSQKVNLEGCTVSMASEVHSRPFAFKVENNCGKAFIDHVDFQIMKQTNSFD